MLVEDDRADHVARVDVVEGDRLAFGCDAAGETLADRYPDRPADLLFQPDRGGGDEVFAVVVGEQDGGGVDGEQFAGAFQ